MKTDNYIQSAKPNMTAIDIVTDNPFNRSRLRELLHPGTQHFDPMKFFFFLANTDGGSFGLVTSI